VTGLALSVVFQVAHCVEEAEFPLPLEDAERIEQAWGGVPLDVENRERRPSGS
jgi:hypothetical protein